MHARFVGRDHPRPWNKGLLVGQKKPLQPKHVWSIRVRLEIAHMRRDLALFNLAIGSKLRACDLVRLRIDEVSSGAMVRDRATVIQKKTGRPVQFEITEQTRASLEVWLRILRATGSRYLFPSRLHARPHLSTRQYSRLVHRWIDSIGLKSIFYGTHRCGGRRLLKSIARLATFVPSSFYSVIQNWVSTVRYLGIEVDDALHIAQ